VEIKPYPFALLNHLTVPFCIKKFLSLKFKKSVWNGVQKVNLLGILGF
jgi:hypothetical protein